MRGKIQRKDWSNYLSHKHAACAKVVSNLECPGCPYQSFCIYGFVCSDLVKQRIQQRSLCGELMQQHSNPNLHIALSCSVPDSKQLPPKKWSGNFMYFYAGGMNYLRTMKLKMPWRSKWFVNSCSCKGLLSQFPNLAGAAKVLQVLSLVSSGFSDLWKRNV